MPALGFVVRPENRPEDLPALAREVEEAGFDELWLWEDAFFAGGIAAGATVLAATSSIVVGVGILPAPVRNPAYAAMEIAALARIHPGRFVAGFGHGPADWMRQVGAKPASVLTLMEETLTSVRALLAGEEVDVDGRYVRLDHVKLDFPPAQPPPIYTGVRRARSLALSGRAADGTILGEPSSPDYVRWAREQIAATRPHRLTVYAWCSVDADGEAARAAVRPVLEERLASGGPQAEHLGDGDPVELATVSGTPEDCAASIGRLAEAGADSVVLVPPSAPADPRALGRELLPLLR